ncbi:MAG: LON peptidase substrate-binding domain-containing protein [Acidobacteriota bacterium]
MQTLLPLFPLDVVLFPNASLPLHIFEDRYKEMVGDCLAQQSHFGILYAHDEVMEEVGCLAEITEVLKRYPDGKLDIMAVGRSRFQVVLLDHERSFLRGLVEPYDEIENQGPVPAEQVVMLLEKYQEIFLLLNKRAPEEDPARLDMDGLSFQIASLLQLSNPLKQRLLTERTEAARVGLLLRYFEQLIPRLQEVEQAVRKAGSNGSQRREIREA